MPLKYRAMVSIRFGVLVLCCLFAPEKGGSPSLLVGRSKALDQRFISLYGWRAKQPIGGDGLTYMSLLQESPALYLFC